MNNNCYMTFLETTTMAYIDKCEKRILSCFSILNGRFNEFKGNLVKKVDTSVYEKQVISQIESLNRGEESAVKQTIHKALQDVTNKTEFYLSKDGNVYMKVDEV